MLSIYFHQTLFILENNEQFNDFAHTISMNPLHDAITTNNIDEVKRLINSGVNVNEEVDNLHKPLHTAMFMNRSDIVKLLVQHGASVTGRNMYGQTMLTMSIATRNTEMIDFFITHGVKSNERDTDGSYPIHLAVRLNYLDGVKKLVEHGAMIDVTNRIGESPMTIAMMSNYQDIIEFLFEKNAFENLSSKTKQFILEKSLVSHSPKSFIVSMIEQGAPINYGVFCSALSSCRADVITTIIDHDPNEKKSFVSQNDVLHVAIKNRSSQDIIKMLIQRGADVNKTSSHSYHSGNQRRTSVLQYAILMKRTDLILMLIDHGADVKAVVEDTTALLCAFETNQEHIVSMLLERGGITTISGERLGELFMNMMTKRCHINVDTIRMLMENCSNLNIVNNRGRSLLYLALMLERLDIFKMLLLYGTTMRISSKYHQNLMIRYVIQHEHRDKELIKMTLEGYDDRIDWHSETPDSDDDDDDDYYTHLRDDHVLLEDYCIYSRESLIHWISETDDTSEDIMDEILSRVRNINAKTEDGYTALHLAVGNKNVAMVTKLIDRRARIDETCYNGNTALHISIENGGTNIAKLLMERGANVHVQNKDKDTPLHLAAHAGSVELVYALLKRGVDVHAQNMKKNTPLHLAVHARSIEIVYALLKRGVDVHAQNTKKNTPLHLAMGARSVEIVYALLKYGAEEDLYKPNTKRKTPIQMNHFDTIHIFLRWFMETDSTLVKVGRELERLDVMTKDIVRTGIVSLRLRNIPSELAIRISILSLGTRESSINIFRYYKE
jgi:ankyrin repeat protein